MDLPEIRGYTLSNLTKINVLLGRNGSGKSRLLRTIAKDASSIDASLNCRYISPERAGFLEFEPNEERRVLSSNALSSDRDRNQFARFKQQSVAQFRKLESISLREFEQQVDDPTAPEPTHVGHHIEKINLMLDAIRLQRENPTFSFRRKDSDEEIKSSEISSGESELVSLAIEALVFKAEAEEGKTNLLLLDEPDVHLHPDLQAQLMNFLKDLVEADGPDLKIIVATHSTSVIGSLQDYKDVSVSFLGTGQTDISFDSVSAKKKQILPIFGAHPLTRVFCETPILLVEGEDDERIWQSACRTSEGRIRLHPCVCGNNDKIREFEVEAKAILLAVYDKAVAYSLRDGDGVAEDLNDEPPIYRLRLKCYEAENLLLTNEVLESLGTDWEKLKGDIDAWLDQQGNASHPHYSLLSEFKDSDYDRKLFKIKDIRNDLMGILASNKPWEVAVGTIIGSLALQDNTDFDADGSIFNYLGEKTAKALIPPA